MVENPRLFNAILDTDIRIILDVRISNFLLWQQPNNTENWIVKNIVLKAEMPEEVFKKRVDVARFLFLFVIEIFCLQRNCYGNFVSKDQRVLKKANFVIWFLSTGFKFAMLKRLKTWKRWKQVCRPLSTVYYTMIYKQLKIWNWQKLIRDLSEKFSRMT